jgi:Gametolysin peptidase M11
MTVAVRQPHKSQNCQFQFASAPSFVPQIKMNLSSRPLRLMAITLCFGAFAKEGSLRVREGPDALYADDQAEFDEDEPQVDSSAFRDLQAINSTKSLGTRTFYFVRVSVRDSTPHTFSLQQWMNAHFQTVTTSFKTVLESCSFGKLRVVNNGGIDVTAAGSFKDYGRPSTWLAEAVKQANLKLGKDVFTMANHIIFCQPRNATWWTAIGPQNGNRVNMHSTTCMSLAVLVHEFGHNMNLLHASEGTNTYGDETGMMGASPGNSDGPKRCFNGYHHYQLRWFEDRHLNLADFTTPRKIQLATFVDYAKTTPAQPVIVNAANYYLQYNRAKGMNEGTKEKKDLVTVVENTQSMSKLYAGLGPGNSYVRVFNGRNLYIAACRYLNATTATQPDVMEITIGYDKNWCGFI